MKLNLKHSPFFLAIAGGTASGKSCLTELLVKHLGEENVSVLLLDFYYRHLPKLSLAERAAMNFDHPDALELELLPVHLAKLKSGQSIEMPDYDFATHLRTSTVHQVPARPIVIVEGILALYLEEARAFYDLKIFIEASEEVRLTRRIARDVRERGRTRESVVQQWEQTVAPMHAQFCQPTKQFADVVLDGSNFDQLKLDSILKLICVGN